MARGALHTPRSWLTPLNSARREVLRFRSDEERVRSFGCALDGLRAQLAEGGWQEVLARLAPEQRARWYLSQLEKFRNVALRGRLRYLNHRLAYRAETHLFPGLGRAQAARIAPRVFAICHAHGVSYESRQVSTLLRRWKISELVAPAHAWLRKLQTR